MFLYRLFVCLFVFFWFYLNALNTSSNQLVPKRMIDEMTQTSDAYIRAPEKVPKGTRGYKKLFAGNIKDQ